MSIPNSMKAAPQWCNWRYVERDGRATKVPFQPNGEPAKSNDPSTWATFEAVSGRGEFVGFFLGGGWFGVDLDECLVDGELLPWAGEIIDRFPDAYAEISPSGRGVKLFCRGGPDAMKGKKRIIETVEGAAKASAVEVYAHGRYFAVTGDALQDVEPGDCSEALEWLLAKYWPPEAEAPGLPGGGSTASVAYHTQTPIEERARRYLERVPVTVCGSSSCHNRTFHVAGQLVGGFNLSPEAALPLLAAWAANGSHKWSEAELRHKVESAAASTFSKPRGWLVDETRFDDEAASRVDFSKLDAKLAGLDPETIIEPSAAEVAEAIEDGPADPGPFPRDIIDDAPGILREIIRFDLETTLNPQPTLALAAALAIMATITGRKVRGYWNTRTNLMIVALAPSGAGKDHSRKLAKDLLAAAGAGEFIGPERVGSHAGIITRMHKSPATLFPIDEIGDLFALIKRNEGKLGSLANIEPLLKQLYSASGSPIWTGDALANADHVKTINQPHLVLHGVCPAPHYWQNLTASNIENGLTARFIVFEAMRGRLLWRPDPSKPIPTPLIEFVRNWFLFSPGPGNLAGDNPTPVTAKYTPEAMELLRVHAEAVSAKQEKEDERTSAIWARCAEKTSKLALVAACARCPFPAERGIEVTAEDMEWGKRIALWTTRRMLFQITGTLAENAEDDRKKRLLKLIPLQPGSISRSALSRKTQFLKRNERASALHDLYEGGLIGIRDEPSTSGPAKVFYYRPAKAGEVEA